MAGPVARIPHPHRTGIDLDPHAPWHVAHSGYTVLVTNPDGTIHGKGREGLYDYDTRILSGYRVRLAGGAPQYVSSGLVDSDHWAAHIRVPRSGGTAEGPLLPEDSLDLSIIRRVGRGMEEVLRVRNQSMAPAETELVLELDADFADVQEADGPRRQQGRTAVTWDAERRALTFDYEVRHNGRTLRRGLRVHIARSDTPPTHSDRATLRFSLRLPPHGDWTAVVRYASLVDGVWREPLSVSPGPDDERHRLRRRWREERPRIQASSSPLEFAFAQAADDLFALRNWEYDQAPDAWFTKAGVPTYTGIFGRDSLTSAWQGALLGPEMMRGALSITARSQATRDSAWHDEEPGKLIHEIRRGPLAELAITPQRAYYGTQTTPAMFILTLSEYWHWTGDDSLLRRYRDVALRTFDWAWRYGDIDGDGFLEYTQRSPAGLKNHAWKDSDEAIRYADGSLVPDPIATVEEQAYHFIALERMAEILVVLGEDERAGAFLERARRLRRQWHEAFWMEDEGFYAMALDPDKRPVRSIGSNAGHALGTGIVPPAVARAVADRLMAPDLFTGWGVRTLSSEHPSYNPSAYHLGTVWPVEQATFALGFKRYGLDDHAETLVSGMLAATGCFERYRLPEALGGYGYDGPPVPTAYPRSNSPQAWSASATIQFVQVLLGLYPFAPARVLALVRPRLPEWLDTVTLHRLPVGDARVTLRFTRTSDGTADVDVLERDGPLHLLRVPPPQDVRPDQQTLLAPLKRWILAHAPGRTARALRIALGGGA